MRPVLLVAIVALAVASPARAANLLANPGAEEGAASPDGRAAVVVPGWTTAGGFTVAAYGTPGFPLAGPPRSGARFFAGGAGGSRATAVQQVRLSDTDRARAQLGRASARLSVRLGTTADPAEIDTADVALDFLDADGDVLDGVAFDDASPFASAEPTVVDKDVLVRSRYIRVTLTAPRERGGYSDGYFDDLSLTLRRATPGAPEMGRTVFVRALKGVVRVRPLGTSRFTRLRGTALLSLGSEVDARRGSVALSTAVDKKGATQRGTFQGGAFEMTQGSTSPLTELVLTRGNFAGCDTSVARAAKTGFGRPVRRLFGRAKGSFRVSARYSAATVRGTTWEVRDTCDTTITSVRSGEVEVEELGAPVPPPSSAVPEGGGPSPPAPIRRRSGTRKVTVKAGETYSAARG